MPEWVEIDGYKVLGEMYDFCEKCQWLFYGFKCPNCGTKNTRIGTLPESKDKKEDEPCSTADTAETN